MSLKSVHIVQSPFFYPTGNTPAVCLTQSLPPEQDADILLLGCGDIRNVLFTAYAGAQNNDRKLDFTCCDIEAEIIARNILALTLIIDDDKGAHVPQLWSIYYHAFIDTDTLSLIQSQAKKLLAHTTSLETWNQSAHAKLVQFGDTITLKNVTKLWELYAIQQSQTTLFKKTQNKLKEQWEAAKRLQKSYVSAGDCKFEGLRATAPFLAEDLSSVSRRYHSYWQSGTCFEDKRATKKMNIANPLFGCERNGLVLHYGIEPTIGFHLSLMYAQLSATSPMSVPIVRGSTALMPVAMQVAVGQLEVWCKAFRRTASRIAIRYVQADAIALCHVLQQHQSNRGSGGSSWYRHSNTYAALVLDSSDYCGSGSAPTAFNVIDTSNLLDHLGSLNVLAACTPLLKRMPTSTLRTEMLVPREGSVANSVKTLLCGDLPTIALLLGLKPVQYWTNANATWHANAALLQGLPKGIEQCLSRPVICWKFVDTTRIRYDASGLARLIYELYLRMFQNESFANKFNMLHLQDKDMLLRKLTEHDLYTRASLASLLRYIQSSHVVDWAPFIRKLVDDYILEDQTLNMGLHHFQALCVHLDVLCLADMGKLFDGWRLENFRRNLNGPFANWVDIPSSICVTLVVPHSAVEMFGDISSDNGTPICELMVTSSKSFQQAIYSDIQIGFGRVEASGKPFTNDYTVSVREDPKGWKGSSPMIVSAMISTVALTNDGDTAGEIIFQLKSTTAALATHVSKLGMFLKLHGSAVGHKDVFLTRYRPNMQGHALVGPVSMPNLCEDDDIKFTIKPLLSVAKPEFQSIQVRYDICSEEPKLLLQNGGIVQFSSLHPFNLLLSIGAKYRKSIELPLPIDVNAAKIKIARKSLWIECLAPVAKLEELARSPKSVFPMHVNLLLQPFLDQLHYVDLHMLPVLQTRLMNAGSISLMSQTSVLSTMTSLEKEAYDGFLKNKSLVMPGRLGLKDTLNAMYSHIFGVRGPPISKFWLVNGPVSMGAVFVDSIRLDVSNQSMVMDAAFLPVQSMQNASQVQNILGEQSHKTVAVFLQDDEERLWKHVLPAFAERCRQWTHKPSCECKAQGEVPLSSKPGQCFMCSCGFGVFPKGYIKDFKGFQKLATQAIRVAIPLVFLSPISPDVAAFLPTSSINVETHEAKDSNKVQHKEHIKPRLEDLTKQIGSCFACGSRCVEEGNKLLRCGGCRFAQYCSKACQVKDWNDGHKQICKQLKQ